MNEVWPGKDGWMKKKPMGLKISTSERAYSKERLDKMINDNLSPDREVSLAKGLPIDILHDFKIHYKGKYRIRYRGKSDISKRYFREPNHCIQEFAKSFAIYPNDLVFPGYPKNVVYEGATPGPGSESESDNTILGRLERTLEDILEERK